MKKVLIIGAILTTITLLTSAKATAQDFVYTPVNPAFGGSPINYQWLLSSANAQNKFQADRDFGFDNDPLANFQESLQRQILSQLTRDVIQERFGDLDLSKPNTLEFGNFTIDIIPGPNGIDISILNLATGESTTITVPNI